MKHVRAHVGVCAGLLGLALLLPGSAAATWPGGSMANVPLCTAGGDQSGAVSVSDGLGGAIVAWSDLRSGNAVIYAQRISAAGAAQWEADGVALGTTAGGQSDPTIVGDGAGGAIVTWRDYRSGSADVYAQRISATGTVQWLAGGVAVCTVADYQYDIVSTTDGAGGVIVAWWDFHSGTGDTYAQRISAAGTAQWTAGGVVVAAGASNQQTPAIAADGAGGAIVAWQDWRNGNYSDVYAQRVSAGGVAQWVANGVVICTAVSSQAPPVIVADGIGGAVISWADNRASGFSDIYAQKVSSGGVVQWTVDGVALSTAAGQQYYPAITSDGAGGAIVTWRDSRGGAALDVYAQRISAAGLVQWTADGAALCTFAGDQTNPTITSDGAGGAIAVWTDGRTGSIDDIYAQKISAAGAVQWPVDGGAVCTAADHQGGPSLVANGVGDVIVTWFDNRNGNLDIYAQGVASDGASLFTMPRITSIRDVANDQGGKVRVAWNRSALDAAPTLEISLYGIWRQASAAAAQTALTGGAPLLNESKQTLLPRPGVFRATTEGDKTLYWEGVGTVAARGNLTYTFVAPTLQDSSSVGIVWTVFMVDAHLAFQPGFYDSSPVSGYSVDNLAPAVPAGLRRDPGDVLAWLASPAADFQYFSVYGSAVDHLDSSETLVRHTTGTSATIAGLTYAHFLVTATDFHGNESEAAALDALSAVPGAIPPALRLYPCQPNPFNPRTTIKYDLPEAGLVRLSVFDVAGRLIRILVDESMSQGRHDAVWDGRDSSGREVGSGSYLARLSFNGRVETVRMGLVR